MIRRDSGHPDTPIRCCFPPNEGPCYDPQMEGTDTVIPARYAELARLAWNRDPSRAISGEEALSLYEANWRHVDVTSLAPRERELIQALANRFGGGHLLTTK
jgi:hypothetical protein